MNLLVFVVDLYRRLSHTFHLNVLSCVVSIEVLSGTKISLEKLKKRKNDSRDLHVCYTYQLEGTNRQSLLHSLWIFIFQKKTKYIYIERDFCWNCPNYWLFLFFFVVPYHHHILYFTPSLRSQKTISCHVFFVLYYSRYFNDDWNMIGVLGFII